MRGSGMTALSHGEPKPVAPVHDAEEKTSDIPQQTGVLQTELLSQIITHSLEDTISGFHVAARKFLDDIFVTAASAMGKDDTDRVHADLERQSYDCHVEYRTMVLSLALVSKSCAREVYRCLEQQWEASREEMSEVSFLAEAYHDAEMAVLGDELYFELEKEGKDELDRLDAIGHELCMQLDCVQQVAGLLEECREYVAKLAN